MNTPCLAGPRASRTAPSPPATSPCEERRAAPISGMPRFLTGGRPPTTSGDTNGGEVVHRFPDDVGGMTALEGATVAVPGPTMNQPVPRPPRMPPAAGEAYDPCAVSTRTLTNAELLAHWHRVVAFLGSRRPDSQAGYDHANLRRRLAAERRRRGDMGHCWLAEEAITHVPQQLYEILPVGGLTLAVVPADTSREEGLPFRHDGQVLTPAQFERFLAQNNVPQVDLQDFYAAHDPLQQALTVRMPPPPPSPALSYAPMLPGAPYDWMTEDPFAPRPGTRAAAGLVSLLPTDLYANPTDLYARNAFLRPVMTPGVDPDSAASRRGAGVNWRGTMLEQLHLGSDLRTIIDPSVVDLNRLQANAPTFDVLDLRSGQLESITHSMRGLDTGNLSPEHYVDKFMRMMSPSAEGSTLNQASALLGPDYPQFATPLEASAGAALLVPEEHVAVVRAAVETLVSTGNLSRPAFATEIERRVSAPPSRMDTGTRALIDASLAAEPITHGGTTYSSWDQVRTLKSQSRAYRDIRVQLTARLRARALGGDLRAAGEGSADALLRTAWRERAATAPLAPMFDALMHNAPIGEGEAAISNWQQLEALLLSGDADAAARAQGAFGEIAQRASGRVLPTRATLASVLALQRLNMQAVSRLQRNTLFPPEVVEYHRLVANGVGHDEALNTVSRGSAARAARISGALTVLTESGRLIYHGLEGDLDAGMVATGAFNVATSVPVGYGGAWLETRAGLGISNWATRGLGPGQTAGMASTGTALGGRLFVSTGIGAVAAPVISLGSMAFQETFLDADFTRIDYYATGVRTAVAGGGGALAAGAAGAAIGSGAPVLGTAIGFLVGFGGYLLVDAIWGDDIEEAVREHMGESGCTEGAAD